MDELKNNNRAEHFRCETCGTRFSVKADILARYPRWQPKTCMSCKKQNPADASAKKPKASRLANSAEENLSVAQVLQRYTEGPFDGVFTDGACTGNPGPGGWGAVYVRNNQIIEQQYGYEAATTNNRMELAALIAGYKMLPPKLDHDVDIWSDSELCVKTINEWAAGWMRNGWRRKSGAVKNLELVQELYALAQDNPRAHLRWIKAHSGRRWNEYADSLATAYMRREL